MKLLHSICFLLPVALFAQESSSLSALRTRLLKAPDSIKQDIYLDLAWEYSLADIDSAEYFSKKGIELGTFRKDPDAVANSKSMLAIVYDIQGKVEESASLYLEIAHYYEDQKDYKELSKAYNNLGVLFFYHNDLDRSLNYYIRSIKLDMDRGDSLGVATSLINLAAINNKKGNYTQSFAFLKRGIRIMQEYPNESWLISQLYEGIANNYTYQRKYDSSIIFFKKALPTFQDTNDLHGIHTCMNGLILSYRFIKKYDSAIHYLSKAEKLKKEYDDMNLRESRYAQAALLFAELQDFEHAYGYQTLYQEVTDSINNDDRLKATNELEQKYRTTQNEAKIARLELEQQQSINQRNIVLLVTSLVIGVSILLFILYRLKAKSEATIAKSLNEKETLLKEIHHRVKNNLQIVSSLLSMQSRFIKDEHALGAVNEGQARVESMALIHQKLYQEHNLSGVYAREYIEELSEILKSSYTTGENIDFNFDVDDLTIDVDTIIPIGLILNELICNSLKYAFPEGKEGKIDIRLKEVDDTLKLQVHDNGIGMDNIVSDKTFGIVLIESLAMKLKASFEISSDNGTCSSLMIKKYKLIK